MEATENTVLLGRPLSLEDLEDVARRRRKVGLADDARAQVVAARAAIDALAAGGDAAPNVYGVNTGFGALSETRIGAADIRRLQRNLIRSHCCGVGAALPTEVVRGMLLLRAQVLAMGHSGVRDLVVDRLCAMLNRGVHPRVPSQGSVGASGDLAPLAHLALTLIGEGEAELDGVVMPSAEALAKAGISPIELEAKEGLALINGTQYMTAIGALSVLDGEALARVADVAGAMSVEALLGSRRPFDERLMAVRPHPGQAASAATLRKVLGPTAASEIGSSHVHCKKVQDAYSLRCMPQVHGATRDALGWARKILEVEVNAVTDNPLVFLNEGERADLISGGNFHGEYLAMALDLAAIALAELANVSERRVEQLVNPHLSGGLTPFLAPNSGLHSGFMIAQVAAASLVSENKVLCHPASVDSIPSSAGKEDHVSMGSVSALKLMRVVDNVRRGLAIEVLAATAGLDQRLPPKPSSGVEAAHSFVREQIPAITDDRPLSPEIEWVAVQIQQGALLGAVERAVGAL
ncbi:MAG: histidine ammonia-lyase [Deltaproteobacteria bacterium]|nr:histidine ammonia-lyase [Deltaproteobacteria bacterium]